MAHDWNSLPLEECMAAIIDYRGKSPRKSASGVPLITAKIIKGGRIERPQEFIADEDYEDWMRRGMPEPGDVVMTTEAPLGEVASLDGRKVALAQRVIALRGKVGVLDQTFLRFLMQSHPTQEQLRARATGTTVLGIRQSELRKVILTLPPYAEQRAIAHILGTLDDKIELNRRTNETLESIARALFKSWFVDFDPVRAKAAGRQPSGMDAQLAAWFPSGFEDSNVDRIPKGWGISTIGEWVSLQRGTTYKSALLGTGAGGPWLLGLSSILRNGGFRSDSLRTYSGDTQEKMYLRPGDLYVSLKDVTQSGDLLGAVARVPQRIPLGRLTQDTVRLDFIGEAPTARREFLYLLLRSPNYREYCRARCMGTTNLSLGREDFLSYSFVAPPPDTLGHLMPLIGSLTRRAEDSEESVALMALRDALLPRLLSGELRVRDLEPVVEEMA